VFDLLEEKYNKPECKGQIYRCNVNMFLNSSGNYVEKVTMRHLRTKSCRGCECCGYLEDDLREFIAIGEGASIRPAIKHGELYRLQIVDVGVDWETGAADEWHIAFVLLAA